MRFGTIIRGIIMLLLLNGCISLPAPDSSTGSKSGEPAQIENTPIAHKFRVGDYFTFDNPTTRWQVASVTGDWVLWRGGNGDWQVTGLNPLLPARQWWSRSRGNGRRNIRDRKGRLFPMKVGASMRFRATVTSTEPPFGWEQNWTCRVTGRETVEMLNEVFETFVVVCGDENSNKMTFNYAPKVGHYVMQRISATADRPARTRKLLAYKHADGLSVAMNTAAFEKPSSMPIGKSPNLFTIAPAGKNAAPKDDPGRRESVSVPAVDAPNSAPPVSTIRNASDSVSLRTPEFGSDTKSRKAATVETGPAGAMGKKMALAGPRTGAAAMPNLKSRPISPPPIRSLARIAPPAVPAPQKPAATGAGGIPRLLDAVEAGVHLASYRALENAYKGWENLARRNGDLLRGLSPDILRVDLGKKGVYYRLYAVPVAPYAAAVQLCHKLRQRGIYCKPNKS